MDDYVEDKNGNVVDTSNLYMVEIGVVSNIYKLQNTDKVEIHESNRCHVYNTYLYRQYIFDTLKTQLVVLTDDENIAWRLCFKYKTNGYYKGDLYISL